MFGRRVKKSAHHDLVLMLLAIHEAHEQNPGSPGLVNSSLKRTFSIPEQWERVEVRLTNDQVVVGTIVDRVLGIMVDGEAVLPHSHHLRVKPYDVLTRIRADE